MSLDKSHAVKSSINDALVFTESYLKARYPVSHELGGSMLFIREESEMEIGVDYALMQFSYAEDGTPEETFYSHVFSGWGTAGLREMRHTYFGDSFDGYCFYLPSNAVIKALGILTKYFDMD